MSNANITAPTVDRTVKEIRRRIAAWHGDSGRIALVPTMGALHDGHAALVRAAKAAADRTVVSVFLNPTQFGPNEDLANYPRTWEADLRTLAQLEVDAVFAPSAEEMYPQGFSTSVSVGGPGASLETDFRPQFLTGVATVVAKLFIACLPDIAVFGEKDYQQLLVIRRMAADLGLPVHIVAHPTVREADGLALSSRNAYLSDAERRAAPALYQALNNAAAAICSNRAIDNALAAAAADLRREGFEIDYIALRNAETLAPVLDLNAEPLRLLAAARLGKTRLIDNIEVKTG